MANEFANFATGFFNALNDRIDVRDEEARDYFNKQVEMARTTGLQNKRRVDAAVNESVTWANKLAQLGVPRDIIMQQADQDPAGLGDFYNQVVKLSTDVNVPMDENFYRSAYNLSKDFSAPDEDFATFFSRLYSPIVTAAQNDPQGLKDNPSGTIWANMFGYNQMDKARAKLATTEVAPGLTAEQAIQYGDQVVPNHPYGRGSVTPNIDYLKSVAPDDPPTPSELDQITKQFNEELDAQRKLMTPTKNEAGVSTLTPEQEQEAKVRAFQVLVQKYGENSKYIIALAKGLNIDPSSMSVESVGEPTEGNDASTGAPPPETPTGPVAAPPEPAAGNAPTSTEPLDLAVKSILEQVGFSDMKDNGDGTSTYTYNGQEYTTSNEELRQVSIAARDKMINGD